MRLKWLIQSSHLHGFRYGWLPIVRLSELEHRSVAVVACIAHACIPTLLAGIWFGTKLSSHMHHLTCEWSPAGPDPWVAMFIVTPFRSHQQRLLQFFLLFLLVWTRRSHDLISLHAPNNFSNKVVWFIVNYFHHPTSVSIMDLLSKIRLTQFIIFSLMLQNCLSKKYIFLFSVEKSTNSSSL